MTAAGDTIWVDLAVGAARADDGRIDHLVAQVVEVTPEVEYADALERTVRRFRYLAENASDVVYEMDAAWHIRWISPSVQNVLGWRPESLVGTVARQLFAPGQEELLDVRGEELRAGFSLGGEVLVYVSATGQHKSMSAMANPIVEPDGTVTGVVVGLRDVTSEIETREDLARVQARLRLAVDAAPGGLAITDVAGILVDVNREFCRLVGRSEQEVLGLSLLSILGAAESGVCPAGDRHEHPRLDRGVQRWLEHAVSEVTSASPSAQAYQVHLFSDITRERELREELRHLANHDVLTGVANRRRIVERLQEVALAPERPDRRIGVLFCDIDTLKAINDSHGHSVGDEVLTAVAERLVGAVRSADEVGRMGGDEFVVLLDELTSEEDLRLVAEKLRAEVSCQVTVDGQPIDVSASIGAALMGPGEDPREALRRADAALLQAKSGGRDRVVVAPAERED